MTSGSSPGASYRFLPAVRPGWRPDDQEFSLGSLGGGSGGIDGPPTAPVELSVGARKQSGGWDSADPVSTDVELYGPGDVRGIDDDQIVRVAPEPGTPDFPPNYFPAVEFDRPDLPWLFSPERTHDRNPDDSKTWRARVRPWITLVVVPETAATVSGSDDGLPIVEVPAKELPPPAETWAWAHAQVVGESGAVEDVVGSEPGRTVARLLCPRNLGRDGAESGGTRYVAAVVPTFEPGRRVGLGQDPYPEGSSLGFAWSPEDSGSVQLPAYYLWEFGVGTRDFESLVDDLEPTRLSTAEVGTREVDVSHPGPTTLVDQAGNQVVDRVGAFQSPSLSVDSYDPAKRRRLRECLNRPSTLTAGTGQGGTDKPVVGAPLYGQWHVGTDTVESSPGWFEQLNLEPTYRMAASLGAAVVRENQESLVADAWDQAGQLDEVNRVVRGGQLSRAASNRIHDRLRTTAGGDATADRTRLLQFTHPVQRRLPGTDDGDSEPVTLDRQLREAAPFPESALSPAFRRLTAPRGALARNVPTSVPDAVASGGGPLSPTVVADELVAGRTTPDDLAADLGERVVTLDDMAARETGPNRMFTVDTGIDDEPPTLLTTTVSSASYDDGLAGEPRADGGDESAPTSSTAVGNYRPDVGAARADLDVDPATVTDVTRDPVGGTTTDDGSGGDSTGTAERDGVAAALPASLQRVHRLGNWARSLPDGDVDPDLLRTATPAEPRAYVLRSVDAQARSGVDHVDGAVGAVRRLRPVATADSIDADRLAEVERAVDAIEANVVGPLDRALNRLLSLREGSVPAAVENDRDALVQTTLDHHRAAAEALDRVRAVSEQRAETRDAQNEGDGQAAAESDSDVTPDGWLATAESHLLRLLDLFEHLRTAVAFGEDALSAPMEFTSASIDSGAPAGDAGAILDALDPDVTIPEVVHARIDRSGDGSTGTGTAATDGGGGLRSREDPLAPVAWSPTFERPMFDPLKRLSEGYLLPGVEDVPRDSVGCLATNPAFVASYMVGLNHEFARELLWRRFPTNRRGTYFRTFWNDEGTGRGERTPDVSELHTWTAESLEGAISAPSVVLVVRGDLLRQYPNTTIYLARAQWTPEGRRVAAIGADTSADQSANGDGATETVKFPTFQESFDPDVGVFGFDLTPAAAVGGQLPAEDTQETIQNTPADDRPDPGWFVVFEEPMGEPRFGLDAGDPADAGSPPMGVDPGTGTPVPVQPGQGAEIGWNGLSWHHAARGDEDPRYLRVWDCPLGGDQSPSDDGFDESATWRITDDELRDEIMPNLKHLKPDVESLDAVWGRNGAHTARITFQRPVRVTVHADDLLGEDASSPAWAGSDGGEA